MLVFIFNSTFQSIPCQSNNMRQTRQCRCLHNVLSQKVLGLLLAESYRPTHHGTCRESNSWSTFIGRWHFCSEWQWYWQWHTWCYWHKLHTLNWQCKLLAYCTCSPEVYTVQVGYKKKSHCISIKTLPTLMFWWLALPTGQLKRLDTRQKTLAYAI
jgi:hypothetical protein